MSPEQVIFWLEYHDVILNDNTTKTNCYQMSLSLFLIVDNNTKSRLVAQALVSDETTESYKWILECTKKATMTEPLVFVTDADPAAVQRLHKYMKPPTQFIVFFTLAKTYQRI